MEKDLVRTCSAAEAAILASAVGRRARVGSTCVCVQQPAGSRPIDPDSSNRYLARVEVLDTETDQQPPAPADAARILSDLFGVYLA